MLLEYKIVYIKTDFKNALKDINKKITEDFNEFKTKNELLYCTCKHKFLDNKNIEVVWSTTKKYKNYDLNLINRDFNNFINDNNGDFCFITKITNQETCCVAEFSIIRIYKVKFE